MNMDIAASMADLAYQTGTGTAQRLDPVTAAQAGIYRQVKQIDIFLKKKNSSEEDRNRALDLRSRLVGYDVVGATRDAVAVRRNVDNHRIDDNGKLLVGFSGTRLTGGNAIRDISTDVQVGVPQLFYFVFL